MALITYPEKTPTRRFASKIDHPAKNEIASKGLRVILPKKSGRASGKITVRHQGGRHKRYYRLIDFKRDKFQLTGIVEAIEYDPNRTVDIALIKYPDGERKYILAPLGLKVGDGVISDERVEVKIGNSMPLRNMPIGTPVHNVELSPGRGGQLGRSAGTKLLLQSKEASFAQLRMPSGEVRLVPLSCRATVGVLGSEDWKNVKLGKAGRARWMGIRPTVRGTAMDPHSHAHGGGEGRSPIGRKKPMTVYGKPAVGKTRKKGKWTNRFILKRRK